MTKATVSQWESTASNNTDVGGINIAEGCPAANVNNALREIMAQLANLYPNLTRIPGITATAAEINYLDGATSNIQDQIDAFGDAIQVTDWNNAMRSGTYWSSATAANIPTAQFQRGFVSRADADNITQLVASAANDRVHVRSRRSGTWSAWAEIPQLVDEDNMASDSAFKSPSQQSVKAYVEGLALGVGQTWQDVLASRTGSNTAYQNTTGRTIAVHIEDDVNSTFAVSTDNVTWQDFPLVNAFNALSTTIPPGNYYRWSAPSPTAWLELR